MPWLSWVISNVLLASGLALLAWVVQRRLNRPAGAHVLWVLVLVKLVTPQVVRVPLTEPRALTPCEAGTCTCGPHEPVYSFAQDTLPWLLLGGWSAGAAVTGFIAWRRWGHFRHLAAHADPAPPVWRADAAQLASELPLRRPPEVRVVPGRLPPLVVAGRRSCVLLPAALLDQLTPSQRSVLLVHELTHVKRGDHLVRLLELTVAVAFWWLPGIRFVGRQLRACEETCCDAAVVAHRPHARRDYARLLLDVLDFSRPQPRAVAPATAMSTVAGLERRLRAILGSPPQPRRRWPSGLVAVGLGCAALPFGMQFDVVGRPALAIVAATPSDAEGCDPGITPDLHPVKPIVCCPS
jgi:bla regulator protein BlaR1